MSIIGIICEYNPFHKGHAHQLHLIRERFGQDCTVVCLMSGNYVQRGAPAIFDKSIRAEAAVRCGADLILELPLTASLSSAEGFAEAGVDILSRICDTLCFGSEAGDQALLMDTAYSLLSDSFSEQLRDALDRGLSFPAARQIALEALGLPALTQPNDLLATEYCKALIRQNAALELFVVKRNGDYHDTKASMDYPSATALRKLVLDRKDWSAYTQDCAWSCFREAVPHCLEAGERSVLTILRTMSEEDFAALPFGSEGLWRKLMHASRVQTSLEAIIDTTKSKRYTHTRIDRMILCAFLGITEEVRKMPIEYVRVLAFNDRGRALLNSVREQGFLLNAGAVTGSSFQQLEDRADRLYGLFSIGLPDAPDLNRRRRVKYISEGQELT